MLTTDGERKIGAPGGANCRSIARVSGNRCASGISSQRKRGAPISTVNSPSAAPPAGNRRRPRFRSSTALAGLGADKGGHAAHAVAAGAGLRAVIVVNPDRRIAAATPRIKRHELVVGLLPARPRVPRRQRSVARPWRRSTITISLPRPFILTKCKLASALMIKPKCARIYMRSGAPNASASATANRFCGDAAWSVLERSGRKR